MDKINNTIKKVQDIYDKSTYFDQYGGSVLLLVIMSIVVFIIMSYCIAKSHSVVIASDWPNQRCNVSTLPFAGFIYHPDGTTAQDYTVENFNYCTQQILKGISDPALEPLVFITSILTETASGISDALQQIRALFDRIRKFIASIVQNIMNRLINIMMPIQAIIYKMQDVLARTEANMTTFMYTTIGAYYSLQSLIGAMVVFFITVLIVLLIAIFVVMYIPIIGPPLALILEIPFAILSIFISLVVIFLTVVLGAKGDFEVPSLKCFDKDTIITMNDGQDKIISEIKTGDVLADNNEVTAIIRVESKGSDMYYLDDIFVSDTHIVNYHGKWIPVSKHPDAIKCSEYTEPYLYCLNTSKKTIVINNITFTDWDEIYEEDIQNIINQITSDKSDKSDKYEEIHKQLDGGFEESTMICLYNGEYKKIKDILIGDKLVNGEKVYGIVEINGINITEQFKYILGENLIVEGGPNLVINDSKNNKFSTLNLSESKNKIKLEKNHDKLYHLLTDKKTFNICNVKICDYNASIDTFLEMKPKKYYL